LAEQSLATAYCAPELCVGPAGAHWPVLERCAALSALKERSAAVGAEIKRLGNIQVAQRPLPDFIEALFDYPLDQMHAEAEWVAEALD
jgi:hypothetical protein